MDFFAVTMAKNGTSGVSKNQFLKAFPTDTSLGDVASFLDGVDNVPVKSLFVNIKPLQAGSGTPAPGNIRAISGWTGVNITRTGKNLLPNKKYQHSATQVYLGGESSNEIYQYLKAGTYTLNVKCNVEANSYYHNSEESGNHYLGSGSNTFTLSNDGYYSFYVYKAGSLNASDITSWQLEFGSTATAYESYSGTIYTVAWETDAGVVYGGTLDMMTGKLSVNRVTYTITSGNTISYQGSGDTAYLDITVPTETNNNWRDVVCSHFESANIVAGGTTQGIGCSGSRIYLRNSLFSNRTIFVSWLDEQSNAGTPLQVSFGLATPQVYNLNRREVATLYGINHIWADVGDVSVEYRADHTIYIGKKIRAANNIITGTEIENKATKNYSAGDLLIVGDSLYKVTSNIANGGAIIPGTNVVATTVAEQLLIIANA